MTRRRGGPSMRWKVIFAIVGVFLAWILWVDISTIFHTSSVWYGDDPYMSTLSFGRARYHQEFAPTADDSDEFSACLLIMDDNPRLSQWIAFHYFALNLRSLIVALDPYSQTSPTNILNRWRRRMTIVEWTDTDFTTKNLTRTDDSVGGKRNERLYKARQLLFYTQCTKYLKEHGRSWTAFIDTDEFVSINDALMADAAQRMHEPGAIPKLLRELRADVNHVLPESQFYQQNPDCYTIPRRLYSGVESTPDEIQNHVPQGFNATRFDTLRFRYIVDKPEQRHGLCKSFVDVSKVPDMLLGYNNWQGSAHRPFVAMCPSQFVNYKYPIGIHHYMGSVDAYLYRGRDLRASIRNRAVWETKALKTEGGADDEIRLWLDGFVQMVGTTEALRLLEGTGIF